MAHAFYGLPNVKVVISIHEAKSVHCKKNCSVHWAAYRNCCHRRRFRCLSGAGEAAFDDEELKVALGLNSANSINSAVCWRRFATTLKLLRSCRRGAQPAGCFGTKRKLRRFDGGLLAKSLGLPVKRFIAATNVTIPCHVSCTTVSGPPKRLRRVIQRDGRESAEQLAACGRVVRRKIWQLKELGYAAVDDETRNRQCVS